MPKPPTQYPDKTCETCGKTFNRKRFNGRLEDPARYLTRRNCSQSCGNTRQDVTKDALHWRARKHMAPTCSECSTTDGLHVHHVDRNPANNDPANLRTLCASCHLKLHWREDREKRLAANPWVVAARSGGIAPQPSTATSSRSVA